MIKFALNFLPFPSSSIYQRSLQKPLLILVCLFFQTGILLFAQPQKTFLWNDGNHGYGFWVKAINCGKASQPGGANNTRGSKITIGTTKEQRFPGTHSVEFWTNSSFEETCNQNFSAERAEISSYNAYRSLGVKEGATMWIGWSEKYTDIDESHISAVFQFRSGCGSGSPAGAINFKQGRQLYLQLRRTQSDIFYRKNILRVEENVWYDWVVSYTYGKGNTGSVRIWAAKAGEPLSYNQPIISEDRIQTMRYDDNCPHLRWGVYRPWSADKKPERIKVEDRMMVKYIGPTRIHTGNGLGVNGFSLVNPRRHHDGSPVEQPDPSPSPSPSPTPTPPAEQPTSQPDPRDCTSPTDWIAEDIGRVHLPGETCLEEGTYSLKGAGADIWDKKDAFHYLYKLMEGDGEIITRITKLDEVHRLSKAGIMMRNSMDAFSPHALVVLGGSGQTGFQRRVEARQKTRGTTFLENDKAPLSLRLVRKGNLFSGYISRDGRNWELYGEEEIIMDSTIYVGLVVNSHVDTLAAEARFDSLIMMGKIVEEKTSGVNEGFRCFDSDSSLLVIEAENFSTLIPWRYPK